MAYASAKAIDFLGFERSAGGRAGKYRGFSAIFAGRDLPVRRIGSICRNLNFFLTRNA
jgi:hypothetical protein